MKKVLLLIAIAATTAMASAVEPQVLEDVTINKLSPDGNFGVSDINPILTIFDFANNQKHVYDGTDGTYTAGNGNCISSSGIVVGSVDDTTPTYWENGTWTALPTGEAEGTCSVNGITPDGSRMCGIVSSTTTGETIILPAIWSRNAEGVYDKCELLPYPTKDFTGRSPQYITAVCISDDGKTIAGQIQDYTGMMPQPIIYRQDEKGEWTYELLHSELLNPTDAKFPEWQEEPKRPEPEDYMSDEKLAAYEEALKKYQDSWYDPELEPNPADYMTAEEIAAYEKDAAVYNAWTDLITSFNEVYFGLADNGAAMFIYNSVSLSGNGRYYGSSATYLVPGEDPEWPDEITYPVIFDLQTGEYTKYSAINNIATTFVADNGDALASSVLDFWSPSPLQAYALRHGSDKFIPLVDYLAYSAETTAWMKENMSHDGVVTGAVNEETGEWILADDYMITGIPTANADMSIIATWTTSDLWDIENYDKPFAYSYVLTPGKNPEGVANTVAGNGLAISVAGSDVIINGDAASLDIYDLNGRLCQSVANPGTRVHTSLTPGLYIVKAVGANGGFVATKAAL